MATVDVTGHEFYGPGYDDSDKRIPDMTIVKRQLGKRLTTSFCPCDLTTFFCHEFYSKTNEGFNDGLRLHVPFYSF